MAKLKTVFICSECGNEISRWSGKCSECGSYNTFNEEIVEKTKTSDIIKNTNIQSNYETLGKIKALDENRVKTDIDELDRVLSGGLVEGSLTLIGGEPGIGKSTLLLQLCNNLGNKSKKVLYVSGEESTRQIKMRADRLGVVTENLYLLAETNMTAIELAISKIQPQLLIIDSIQTMQMEGLQSAPGSVTQVRECTSLIMRFSKGNGITSLIVGHVTKEGAIAGPRVLEHMVDCVIYFEGERRANYRIIRAVKNRFGATDEIGVFEMQEKGLVGITNPSEYMLSGRPINVAGSCVTCAIEGTRPILTEVQALATHTTFGMPRRVVAGLDFNRSVMLIAVLEKRCGMMFGQHDIYFNIAGGMKIVEPSLDAAAIAACSSSYKNIPIDPYTLVFGEIGLAGEMRAVGLAERRVAEAAKLGFKQCIIPEANMKGIKKFEGLRIFGVSNVVEMLDVLF